MNKTITLHDEDGEERRVEFPADWIVCPDCDGQGTTYLGWTSADQPAFTAEDFAEEGPDFYHDYMSGCYDKNCPTCHGRTTVKEVFARESIPKELLSDYDAWQEHLKEEAEYQSLCAAERHMPC